MVKQTKKTLQTYEKKVISLLKESGMFKPGLEPHILAMATALRNLDKINADIDDTVHCVYTEKTAYGTRIQENPLFNMAGKQLTAISRAAKSLGLDCDKLLVDVDDDPLVEITHQLTEKRQTPEIIKPLKEHST